MYYNRYIIDCTVLYFQFLLHLFILLFIFLRAKAQLLCVLSIDLSVDIFSHSVLLIFIDIMILTDEVALKLQTCFPNYKLKLNSQFKTNILSIALSMSLMSSYNYHGCIIIVYLLILYVVAQDG